MKVANPPMWTLFTFNKGLYVVVADNPKDMDVLQALVITKQDDPDGTPEGELTTFSRNIKLEVV